MDYIKHIEKLKDDTSSRILLLILDGLGGLPIGGQTALEAAWTPNLDHISKRSALGLSDPIAPGFTPGSGPAHLSLFGYDPFNYNIGRGILEALGIDMEISASDISVRGNFATIKEGLITNRRAGRISTEENEKIINILSENIKNIDGTDIILKSGKEHRFVALFRGQGLEDNLSDADPQKENLPPVWTKALDKKSERTAEIINKFIKLAGNVLKDQNKANYVLLRGFSKYPELPQFPSAFALKAACIATYPMYRGLAKLVGMDILEAGQTIEDQINSMKKYYDNYNFFFFHIKKTDSYGEDGNFINKVKTIEEFDKYLPDILETGFEVIAITADHSTPSVLKSHSWHPNPLLIHSDKEFRDGYVFTEKECRRGSIGRINSVSILPLLMANAGKLKKYGA